MMEIVNVFISFTSKSYQNILIIFVIGIVFRCFGTIYEGRENGNLQLIAAGASKIIFFVCCISACAAFFFNTKTVVASSFYEYDKVCKNEVTMLMGGEDNIKSISEVCNDLNIQIDNIADIRNTSQTAKNIVIELSERERELFTAD